MLFKETVTAATLDLIAKLMRDPYLRNFYLVGGTALSLKIGHRKSIDIDLFTSYNFSSETVGDYMRRQYKADLTFLADNCVKGQINGVEFDFISHRYPILKSLETIDGIRMMSLEDIAAMKINAIVGSGKRIKDYIDIHYLLKKIDYGNMLKFYCAKYPNVTAEMASSSLLYHKDIDFNVPVMIYDTKLKWKDIETSITKAIHGYERALQKPDLEHPKIDRDFRFKKQKKDEGHDKDHGLSF